MYIFIFKFSQIWNKIHVFIYIYIYIRILLLYWRLTEKFSLRIIFEPISTQILLLWLPTSIFYICKPHLTLHLPPLKSSPTSPTTILYSIYLIGNIECTTYVYSCGNIFSHSLLCECLHCHPLVHKSVKSSLNFDVGSSFGFRASIESSVVHSIVHLKVFNST